MNNEKRAPIVLQRADPYLYKHTDGYYYFTGSVPSYDRIELRRSKTIAGLAEAETFDIWFKHESGIMSEHVWAPELHYLDGEWYIYFAASDKDDIWALRPYVLHCTGQDPLHDKWEELGQLMPADDDNKSLDSFSLDVTVFDHKGKRYCIWAEKVDGQKGISSLYLAEMASPTKLKTVQFMLTTPDYDWERVDFWVNEGPSVLKRNGKIFVSFSASATGPEYCMGLIYADEDADLLDRNSWTKLRYPVVQTDEKLGIYGPGHNSFTQDEEGNDICVYHARDCAEIVGDPLYNPNRHAHIMKVSYDEKGFPVFEL